MSRRSDDARNSRNGIPVTVVRDGETVSIKAAGFGEVSERLDHVVSELTDHPEGSFSLSGTLALYRGWTRQPAEVCESFLEDAETAEGVRAILLVHDIESLGERSLAGLDYSERFRILADHIRDSDAIQKRFRSRESAEQHSAADDNVNDKERDDDVFSDESETPAVDVLYSCGYLDLEGVETRLVKMRRRVEQQKATIGELRERLDSREAERNAQAPLLELGKACLKRLCDEAVSRLRAVQLARGEVSDDAARLAVLGSSDPDPFTVQQVHRRVTEEFRALYPTSPRAAPVENESGVRVRWDWDAFRIAHSHGENGKGPFSDRH